MTLEVLVNYIFPLVILLISVWLHEYAHAWTSYKLWDPTPVLQWRLTPNPFKHIDIIWLISVFLIWFWWWKPVITNPIYYKDSRKWDILVAFAWPAMNLLLAFFWVIVMMIYSLVVWFWVQDLYFFGGWDLVVLFWQCFVRMNIALAIFNMFPVPPLDWYRLIKVFWREWTSWIEKNMQVFVYIFVILMCVLAPIIWEFISYITDIVYRLILVLFGLIFY